MTAIPFFDPTDERYRWCFYCKADCWPEPENQRHTEDCPSVTGLWPIDQADVDNGARCGRGCGHVFEVGEVYMDTEVIEHGRDKITTVTCVGCAAGDMLAP
ncbi:hypothetical protein [Actinophytocola sp.]|uniref:hypothetical protein n=1 Tax=Actinophytocola sp. TaxID=1872138 RepID=UPI002D60A631|nr:hypothetical protein [Actinophytocola sp.]HYQ69063.1 hypothetical protein [Actinophytocola sp.]